MNVLSQSDDLQPSQGGSPVQTNLTDLFGITALLQMLRRRFALIALIGVTVALAAFTFFITRAPIYEATAQVIINPRQEQIIANQNVMGDLPRDTTAIDSEIELLRSPAMMAKLAEAIRLIDRGQTQTQAENSAANHNAAAGDTQARDPLADQLSGQVSVRRRGMTYVIDITAADHDPARAQLIANTFANVYIASQIELRIATNERAGSWLDRRLETLRQDVQQKESAAEQFRAQSGLLAASGSSLAEQQITNVQNSVLQAQADLAEKQARYQQLRDMQASGASADTIGTALSSGTIQSLRDREADIARRQADMENRYLPTHPSVQAIRAEHADVQRQIQSEIQRIAINLRGEVDVAQARLATMQGSLHQAAGELNSDSAQSVHLRELEREAAASRQVYEAYLQRYQEIADRDQLNTSDARLMAYARAPIEPSSPKLKISLVLAIALGLFLGFGAGVGAEIFDQSVKNADDLENQVGVPAITSVPVISEQMMRLLPPAERTPAGYLVGRPLSAFTEALRVLRTVIVYSAMNSSSRVVALTSALPNEGKTTLSVCLARVAAMSGQKVIVVDCDLRKQSLNDIVDVDTEIGILHVLAGEASWKDAVVRDPASDADVLPVATPSFTARDVFGSDAMVKLVNDLRAEYDLVILDCAPILAIADTRVIVKLADSVVLVARAGKSAIGAVRAAIMQTEGAGGNILGVALNCVRPNWHSYSDSIYFYQSKSYYTVP